MSAKANRQPGTQVLLVSPDANAGAPFEDCIDPSGRRLAITSFDHAIDALRHVESQADELRRKTCVCVFDLATPDLPAQVFAENLHALPAGAAIPLLLLLDEARLDEARLDAAADVIIKPLRPRELCMRLRTAARLQRLG